VHAGALDESIEAFAWSPSGECLALQTVGAKADRAGAQGSGTLQRDGGDLPDWTPEVEDVGTEDLWRRLWLYRPGDGNLRRIGPADRTFWEIAWCGNEEILAVVSADPRENGWYKSTFVAVSTADGAMTTLYQPRYEIGLPAGSPDGAYAVIVDATCSDRTIVAGDIVLFDRRGRTAPAPMPVDAEGVDVTCVGFRDPTCLYFAGVRDLQVVAGEIDVASSTRKIHWVSDGGALYRYPGVTPLGKTSFATVAHAYDQPPHIVRFENREEDEVHDLAHDGSEYIQSIAGEIEPVAWSGRDGLEIRGLLTRPRGNGPFPLVVMVHGGPTSCYTNVWQMHRLAPILAARGYAVLHPNVRGSTGRGQDFMRMVRGDMNGEDTFDIIAGVEALVANGSVDVKRVGVTGVSYGGMMTSWIVTQTDLFAAAISVSPVTDNLSFHYTTNIPEFDRQFFLAEPGDIHGKQFARSAILFADRVRTPVLNVAGAKDRCTPPTQAVEFHRALLEHGTPTELVIYPLEGHGVRGYDAFIDFCTRTLLWLERYMPATPS
jgi:dipeptidyl aminopeptidase/acylaminoacyl peptidase